MAVANLPPATPQPFGAGAPAPGMSPPGGGSSGVPTGMAPDPGPSFGSSNPAGNPVGMRDAGMTVTSQPDAGSSPDAGSGPDAGPTQDADVDAASPADASSSDTTVPTLGGTCEPGPGGMTVNATIVVEAGQTFDGECQRYIAGPAVGDGSQSESQKPVFRLEQGATLVNVVLGSPAADGIHTYGDATLRNIVWEDIGEDALTIKAPGSVSLAGGGAFDGSDKVFQINAESTFSVSHFRADNAGKFIRQNGGTTFTINVFIDECDISNMDEAIFRTDSAKSSVTMTNTRYSRIGSSGDALWYNVNPGNISERDNVEY